MSLLCWRTTGGRYGVFLGISVEDLLRLPQLCVHLWNYGGLALVSSLSCRLQSTDRDVIFNAGVFLRVLIIIALPKVVDCLFKSHRLDVIMDIVAERVSVFTFKKDMTM